MITVRGFVDRAVRPTESGTDRRLWARNVESEMRPNPAGILTPGIAPTADQWRSSSRRPRLGGAPGTTPAQPEIEHTFECRRGDTNPKSVRG